MKWIITLRIKHGLEHDPRDKTIGLCHVHNGQCTDSTGEHHSFIATADTLEDVIKKYSHLRISRIEEAREFLEQ